MTDEGQSAELGPWARLANVLVHFICQFLSHIENIVIGILFIGLCTKEQSIWKCDRNDVFENTHIERRALETMTQDKEVHTLVVCDSNRWINFLLETWMLIDFEGIGNSVGAFVSDEALLKDEWCIPLHILDSSILLTLLINNDVQLFHWLLILSIQLNMHLNNFSRLPRNHIIKLSSEVLRRETEVLSQHDMPENVLAISPLNCILILP